MNNMNTTRYGIYFKQQAGPFVSLGSLKPYTGLQRGDERIFILLLPGGMVNMNTK